MTSNVPASFWQATDLLGNGRSAAIGTHLTHTLAQWQSEREAFSATLDEVAIGEIPEAAVRTMVLLYAFGRNAHFQLGVPVHGMCQDCIFCQSKNIYLKSGVPSSLTCQVPCKFKKLLNGLRERWPRGPSWPLPPTAPAPWPSRPLPIRSERWQPARALARWHLPLGSYWPGVGLPRSACNPRRVHHHRPP